MPVSSTHDTANEGQTIVPDQNMMRAFTRDRKISPLASSLRDVREIDATFPMAAAFAGLLWLFLLACVYGFTPKERWLPLEPEEQNAAFLAFVVMFVTNVIILLPRLVGSRSKASGIVGAALVVVTIAMTSNAIMAFCPTVVLVDPVTQARVYLVRYCEWTPLGGLMTYVCEAIDAPKGKRGLSRPVTLSLMQTLSVLCGLYFPLCPDKATWLFVMSISCSAFLTIIPRVVSKRSKHLKAQALQGNSMIENEYRDRVRFAYVLISSCTTVWTLIILLYLFVMCCSLLLPEGHPLRRPSLPMLSDAFFDVVAKSMYMKFIMDVHEQVFDAVGRAARQLEEMSGLLCVLWGSSSDAIVISVRHGGNMTTMFSPSFPTLMNLGIPREVLGHESATLTLGIESPLEEDNPQESHASCTYAYFATSRDLPSRNVPQRSVLVSMKTNDPLVEKAEALALSMWNHALPMDKKSVLVMKTMESPGSEDRHFEIKISPHEEESRIAVVRDVTDRYRLLENERKAHAETLMRQKEAQQANRFTIHEVKNGLLAGIELCGDIRSSTDNPGDCSGESSGHGDDDNTRNTRRYIDELDTALHEILDTVLAEAMARDVIHGSYQPRPEHIDLKDLLTRLGIGKVDRFPLRIQPGGLPFVSLDPQLIRYILRNAFSNACKYGKEGGLVATEVTYNDGTSELVVTIRNEPGKHQSTLVAMGETVQDMVFSPGVRLDVHNNEKKGSQSLSAGDGAWIMQKCAESLGGKCTIRFSPHETQFALRCQAEAFTATDFPDANEFEVPSDTWAICIDDSKIQRRLLAHIAVAVGVRKDRCTVLGQNQSDLVLFEQLLFRLLEEHKTDKFLILADENLDYGIPGGERQLFSGSLLMQSILKKMTQNQESRVLALIRSANDSIEEIARFKERAHGFFPKISMNRERTREMLSPLWAKRFLSTPITALKKEEQLEDVDIGNEIWEHLETIDGLISQGPEKEDWELLWVVLHSLKGDLMAFEGSEPVMNAICDLRGHTVPEELPEKWQEIRRMTLAILEA